MLHRLKFWTVLLVVFGLFSLTGPPAHAQLRIVDYNTAGVPNSSAMTTVLDAIGDEVVNGVTKPIDVLILQELSTGDITTVLSIMNGLGVGTYVAGNVGSTTGAGGVGLIYRDESVDLLEQLQVVNTSTGGAARGVMRYKLVPDDYTSPDAEFYIYGSHYKASQGSTNEARRDVEATAIRVNADALAATRQLSGQISNFIYAGDFNIYNSDEPMWDTLTDTGLGQAFDPMDDPDLVGTWHDGADFKSVHTQNPAGSGFVGGGMDDRFDWQMISSELKSGEGLAYIGPVSDVPEMAEYDHSYHAFGNDNTHDINGHINTGDGNPTILNALGSTSDHLPVVADYQLPARLFASVESVPATLELGEVFTFDVTVSNGNDLVPFVLAPIGADELDYEITTFDDVSGSTTGTDMALGGGIVHMDLITLDTSSVGMKTGTIRITSSSQAVETPLVEFEISYEVIGASLLVGDYNGDGKVSAADYTVWRNHLGAATLTNRDPANSGPVGPDDFESWKDNYGVGLGSGASSGFPGSVPEPTALIMLLMLGAACGAARHLGRFVSRDSNGIH